MKITVVGKSYIGLSNVVLLAQNNEVVALDLVKCMIKKGINVCNAKVLNLGITFKENCPDVRNTKIIDVISALEEYGLKVTTYDPWANPAEVLHEYGKVSVNELPDAKYDAIVLGVAHKEFLDIDLKQFLKEGGVIYDVKGILEEFDNRL